MGLGSVTGRPEPLPTVTETQDRFSLENTFYTGSNLPRGRGTRERERERERARERERRKREEKEKRERERERERR